MSSGVEWLQGLSIVQIKLNWKAHFSIQFETVLFIAFRLFVIRNISNHSDHNIATFSNTSHNAHTDAHPNKQ